MSVQGQATQGPIGKILFRPIISIASSLLRQTGQTSFTPCYAQAICLSSIRSTVNAIKGCPKSPHNPRPCPRNPPGNSHNLARALSLSSSLTLNPLIFPSLSCTFNTLLNSFPLALFGTLSTNSISTNHLYLTFRSFAKANNFLPTSTLGLTPALNTTKPFGLSPEYASGIPITAASSTSS